MDRSTLGLLALNFSATATVIGSTVDDPEITIEPVSASPPFSPAFAPPSSPPHAAPSSATMARRPAIRLHRPSLGPDWGPYVCVTWLLLPNAS
jgi:hypothetical protein